ncbi:hypothetical protein ACWFNS_14245 [Oerskovia enterophila]
MPTTTDEQSPGQLPSAPRAPREVGWTWGSGPRPAQEPLVEVFSWIRSTLPPWDDEAPTPAAERPDVRPRASLTRTLCTAGFHGMVACRAAGRRAVLGARRRIARLASDHPLAADRLQRALAGALLVAGAALVWALPTR